jgi:hypothetical protein
MIGRSRKLGSLCKPFAAETPASYAYFEVVESQQITRSGATHVRKPPGFLVALGRVFVGALALENRAQSVVGMRGRGVELQAPFAEVLHKKKNGGSEKNATLL